MTFVKRDRSGIARPNSRPLPPSAARIHCGFTASISRQKGCEPSKTSPSRRRSRALPQPILRQGNGAGHIYPPRVSRVLRQILTTWPPHIRRDGDILEIPPDAFGQTGAAPKSPRRATTVPCAPNLLNSASPPCHPPRPPAPRRRFGPRRSCWRFVHPRGAAGGTTPLRSAMASLNRRVRLSPDRRASPAWHSRTSFGMSTSAGSHRLRIRQLFWKCSGKVWLRMPRVWSARRRYHGLAPRSFRRLALMRSAMPVFS